MFIVKFGTKSVARKRCCQFHCCGIFMQWDLQYRISQYLLWDSVLEPVTEEWQKKLWKENDLAWRVLNFIVISSYGSIF